MYIDIDIPSNPWSLIGRSFPLSLRFIVILNPLERRCSAAPPPPVTLGSSSPAAALTMESSTDWRELGFVGASVKEADAGSSRSNDSEIGLVLEPFRYTPRACVASSSGVLFGLRMNMYVSRMLLGRWYVSSQP